METVLGTYRDGKVILEHEVNWPNRASLEVRLGSSIDTTAHCDREECYVSMIHARRVPLKQSKNG